MNNARMIDGRLETVAWSALLIWWGLTAMFHFLPQGTGAIGVGLIFLGLNLARSLQGIPTSTFTTTLGILALVLGVLEIAGSIMRLPFELPVFAILLIVLGMIMLGREVARNRTE